MVYRSYARLGLRRRQPDIHIVAGFSCSGKSTFIRQMFETGDLPSSQRPVYEFMLRNREIKRLKAGDVFHLDISAIASKLDPAKKPSIDDHPLAKRCLRWNRRLEITMLIASKSELRKRILGRKQVGFGWSVDCCTALYPQAQKLDLLEKYPLDLRYKLWFDHFQTRKIPCRIFQSAHQQFVQIESVEEALSIINT